MLFHTHGSASMKFCQCENDKPKNEDNQDTVHTPIWISVVCVVSCGSCSSSSVLWRYSSDFPLKPRSLVRCANSMSETTECSKSANAGPRNGLRRKRKRERKKEREKERQRERERKREREKEKERLGAPHSLYQALLFAFDQMSSWHSAAGFGWYGSYGSWYGRRRSSWGGKSEVRSDVEWFCQKCGTGDWWSRTDCRHCASVTSDDSDIPQSSTREKLLSSRRHWLVWATTSLSWLLEKELEKLQKKLNGPKKTAKHIEAKQNWINRASKRLEAETVRLTELQESLGARKETLKVAYGEIKIPREDLLREGESMDKNKSHFLSPEDTEEIRRLEQQELAFWRGSASKRLAGWTRARDSTRK